MSALSRIAPGDLWALLVLLIICPSCVACEVAPAAYRASVQRACVAHHTPERCREVTP